ncbi:MAG: hypothetical protein IKN54_03150 [Lachnospiraceae bacterium]|nr:hypothetical protein [Lachnospiraceae bacterium]
MSKLQKAVGALHEIDFQSAKRRNRTKVNPLARLIVTVIFICLTLSFEKMNVYGCAGMLIYVLVQSILDDIDMVEGIKRFAPAFAVLLVLGVSNGIVFYLSGTKGAEYTMIVLLEKGALAVLASYILFIQIGIEGICSALYAIHVPGIMITVLMLNYRYVIVILKEIERMLDAYRLRSAEKKGIHISAWGSFAGLLLIRCIERAKDVYSSMTIRGYNGEMMYFRDEKKYSLLISFCYAVVWTAILILLRIIPVFTLIGNFFV